MKSLKIVSFLFALIVMGTFTGFAQSSEGSLSKEQKEQIANNLEAYYAVLDLSETQKGDFEAITQKYAKQMIAVKNEGGSKWKKYNKVKAIRSNKDAEMAALLSADQYRVYMEKQKELQEKMKEMRD